MKPAKRNLTPLNNFYDERRATAKQRGYDVTWMVTRERKLSQTPYCEVCGVKLGTPGVKFEVHHIKSIKEYPHLRLEMDNLQTLCKSCHAKEEHSRRGK